ncbi:MAG: heme exporter protein CcmB [Cytophagales bacterium]|nr:heme exporter protein CcmB [Cytophagales bacterium]
MSFKSIFLLLRMDLYTEWQGKVYISQGLLSIGSLLFLLYLSTGEENISVPIWNSIFWFFVLFLSIHLCGRTVQEDAKYLSSLILLCSALELLLSKIFFHWILLFTFSLLFYLCYGFLWGYQIPQHSGLGLLILGGSTLGLSTVFSWIGLMIARTQQGAILLPTLGLPLLLPILLLCISSSENLIYGEGNDQLLILWAVLGLYIGASLLLFPYLWDE